MEELAEVEDPDLDHQDQQLAKVLEKTTSINHRRNRDVQEPDLGG